MSDNSLNTKKAALLFQAAAIFILTAIAARTDKGERAAAGKNIVLPVEFAAHKDGARRGIVWI